VLLLVLTLCGAPWLYLIWMLAYLSSYLLVARIRHLAEHGGVAALYERDPRGNTRTTRTNLIERLIFAPNNVNFHIEHHLLPSVPCWQLPRLRTLIKERGFYRDHPNAIANSYWQVIRQAVPELAGSSTTTN
jgi:fatty acid desaturase